MQQPEAAGDEELATSSTSGRMAWIADTRTDSAMPLSTRRVDRWTQPRAPRASVTEWPTAKALTTCTTRRPARPRSSPRTPPWGAGDQGCGQQQHEQEEQVLAAAADVWWIPRLIAGRKPPICEAT